MFSKRMIAAGFLVLFPVLAASGSQAAPAHRASIASIENLRAAVKGLREAVEAMRQTGPAPARVNPVTQVEQALLKTKEAAASLPADPVVSAPTETDYESWVRSLQDSVQTLRATLQALARQPEARLRQDAIEKARAALNEVEEAIMSIPPSVA